MILVMARPRRLTAEKVMLSILQVDVDSEDDDFYHEDNADNEVLNACHTNDAENSQSDDSGDNQSDDDDDIGDSSGSMTDSNIIRSRDGTIWKQDPPVPRGRNSTQFIVRNRGGPKQFIRLRADNELDVFMELFGPNTLETILRHTKKEAEIQGISEFSLTIEELHAFLGLCVIRGVTHGKNEPLYSFWNSSYGPSVFRETMSRNKFLMILKLLRFDNKDSRASRKQTDKYAPIRELWTTVMDNCQKCFFPHGFVTIDEQLFSCKSRCSFIQYMPQKPGKFGMKYWLICDSNTSYVLRAEPYTGKDEQRELSLGEHVVTKLMEPYFHTGLTVTTDNYFTSLRVMRTLLEKDITMVGTVRQNRREIPTEMLLKSERLYTSKFAYTEDDIMLTSYKAKRNKNVLLLSSLHCNPSVDDSTEKKKPGVVLFYNGEKGGVDTADQMLRCYSTKCASRRWTLSAFFNLLDIVCLDAYIIAVACGMCEKNRRKFLLHLGETLCQKERKRRSISESQKPLPIKIRVIERTENKENAKLQSRTSCRMCQKNKTRESCHSCNTFVCGTCSKLVCKKCLDA